MSQYKKQSANKAIKQVTILGIVVNIALGILKVVVGLLVHSISLVADGVHSFSDLASDIAVLLGIHFSSKEPDKEHPYGHGRAETFSAFLIAAILVLVGSYMIYYAAMDVTKEKVYRPSVYVIIIAAVSVVFKEVLYLITRKVAVRLDSSMLYANAWHHRTDALSSLVVIVGVTASYFGFEFGDHLAAVAVGMLIIAAGAGVIGKCIREISEMAIDETTIGHVKDIINSSDGVRSWHRLRTRAVGREIFMDLHILVDRELKITQAHQVAEKLENQIHADIARPVNITVHIEPDIDELRK